MRENVRDFARIVGFKYLRGMHLNDAKAPLAAALTAIIASVKAISVICVPLDHAGRPFRRHSADP